MELDTKSQLPLSRSDRN